MRTIHFDPLDPLYGVLTVFVVVGLALTAVAGYALLTTFDVTLSTGLVTGVLSGASLLAFLVVLSTVFRRRTPKRGSF